MGFSVREKHHRSNRKPRSIKLDTDNNPLDRTGISNSLHESAMKPSDHLVSDDGELSGNPNPNPNFDFDESGFGYYTEDQLEERLLQKLEDLYDKAISKLIALGYYEDVALKAVLRNGHCYGSMDVLNNIVHNSLAYLNSSCSNNHGTSEEPESVFGDLRQLEKYSLAGMVCLLQRVRPHLSKGDAMWCLLMSDLHVGRASTMEIPVMPAANSGSSVPTGSVETENNKPIGVSPSLYKFDGGLGYGSRGVCDIPVYGGNSSCFETTIENDGDGMKRFNLTPSMKSRLERNVALFSARLRANKKSVAVQSQTCPSDLSNAEQTTEIVSGSEIQSEECEEPRDLQNLDVMSSVLSSLGNLNLDENPDGGAADQKNEMILNLIHQIRELEGQVKERKEWAHQRAMQAARKLSHDLTELKMLRMEREDTQWLKKGKQALEETTMKRLSEMENALRKASSQVDRANAAVRRLEIENAEIRAEMEASKLSAEESVTDFVEVEKKEKKYRKRLLALEKQKTKLQEEVAEEKQKITQLQQQLLLVKETHKETEVR